MVDLTGEQGCLRTASSARDGGYGERRSPNDRSRRCHRCRRADRSQCEPVSNDIGLDRVAIRAAGYSTRGRSHIAPTARGPVSLDRCSTPTDSKNRCRIMAGSIDSRIDSVCGPWPQQRRRALLPAGNLYAEARRNRLGDDCGTPIGQMDVIKPGMYE